MAVARLALAVAADVEAFALEVGHAGGDRGVDGLVDGGPVGVGALGVDERDRLGDRPGDVVAEDDLGFLAALGEAFGLASGDDPVALGVLGGVEVGSGGVGARHALGVSVTLGGA